MLETRKESKTVKHRAKSEFAAGKCERTIIIPRQNPS